jgi:hypothetical protein
LSSIEVYEHYMESLVRIILVGENSSPSAEYLSLVRQGRNFYIPFVAST